MLKPFLIGIAFIICTAGGLHFSKKLCIREQVLRELCDSIRNLINQIAFSRKSLDVLIAKNEEGLLAVLWRNYKNAFSQETDMTQVWENCVTQAKEENPEISFLTDAELKILHQFITALGTTDVAMQKDNALLAINALETCANAAKQQTQQYGRLYKVIGVLCGAAFVVLLI